MACSRAVVGIAAVVGVLSAACVPVPHFETDTPEVTGTVTRQGRPVAGAAVYAFERHNCAGSATTAATTDAAGHFSLDRSRTFEWYYFVLGDRRYSSCVRIVDGADVFAGISWSGWAPVETAVIQCELDSKGPVTSQMSGEEVEQHEVCTVSVRPPD
jgi:hypothetical protein